MPPRSAVQTLAECCTKTGWQVHVYVLMPNHFHLVVETPQLNLFAGMKWFLGTYKARFIPALLTTIERSQIRIVQGHQLQLSGVSQSEGFLQEPSGVF